MTPFELVRGELKDHVDNLVALANLGESHSGGIG